MQKLHSFLNFETEEVGNYTNQDVPEVIYRYFGSREDRENFLNGEIWFSGPSQNRFFHPHPDKFEYRYSNGTFLHEYALSCSEEILDETKYNVKIVNPKYFVQEIINTIKENNNLHRVSWFSKDDLGPFSSDFPTIRNIKKLPTKENELISLVIDSLGCRKVEYVDKSKEVDINIPFETFRHARAQSDEFSDEKEVRIHINSGGFLSGYQGGLLLNFVQYLKISCPSIKKHCFPI